MRDHAAVTHGTEGAQTLSIGSVDLGHSKATEVALSEQEVLSPQGGTVWVKEHLKWRR